MSKPKAPGFFGARKLLDRKFDSKLAHRPGSQAEASGNFRLKINATTIATAPMK